MYLNTQLFFSRTFLVYIISTLKVILLLIGGFLKISNLQGDMGYINIQKII